MYVDDLRCQVRIRFPRAVERTAHNLRGLRSQSSGAPGRARLMRLFGVLIESARDSGFVEAVDMPLHIG